MNKLIEKNNKKALYLPLNGQILYEGDYVELIDKGAYYGYKGVISDISSCGFCIEGNTSVLICSMKSLVIKSFNHE